MRPHRRVFVVGGAHSRFLGRGHPDFIWRRHPDYGSRENPTLEEHIGIAVRGALDVTGTHPEQIDKGYIGNFLGECFAKQGHLGAIVASVDPALSGKPFARTEAACASGGVAITACMDALQAGNDVALAVGAEVETNAPGRDGVEYMAYAAHYAKQRHLDFALFPHLFARRALAYKEAFGASQADLGRAVVQAYQNAKRNPYAQMQTPAPTLDQVAEPSDQNRAFLEDARYRDHLRLMDCTNFTDGASALVLATEAGLARLGVDPGACTEILSYGHTVQPLGGETDPAFLHNVADAARIAWRDAGVGPEQADVAEVHDCFSVAFHQGVEALGLAEPGGAAALLRDGETGIGGRIPVNTGGGLLGFGHPVGATGVKQVVEIWRQMKGRCGDYQLPKPPRIGVTANLGGDDRTAIVMVHRNVA